MVQHAASTCHAEKLDGWHGSGSGLWGNMQHPNYTAMHTSLEQRFNLIYGEEADRTDQIVSRVTHILVRCRPASPLGRAAGAAATTALPPGCFPAEAGGRESWLLLGVGPRT